MRLRPYAPKDQVAVLALNEASVDALSPLDGDGVEALIGWDCDVRVVELDDPDFADVVAAFVVTFPPGSAYTSENYQWFAARYTRFVYLDRFVVDERFRRRGIGSFIYETIEREVCDTGLERLVCEVNLEPRNDPSLVFHARREYVEVGQLDLSAGKRVSLLTKELGSVLAPQTIATTRSPGSVS